MILQSKPRSTTLFWALAICLLVLISSSIVAAHTVPTTNATATEIAEPQSSFWDIDIFHLPADVPFPGAGWLERVAVDSSPFAHPETGTIYSSAYAALLDNDPLQHPCRNFNAWINSIVLPDWLLATLLQSAGMTWGHYLACYLRNFVGAMLVYYGTAGIFHFFCYVHPQSTAIFEGQKRIRPDAAIMWDQIRLAQASMMLYVMLPVVDEWLIENGYTKAYYTVAEIGGWYPYALAQSWYFLLVEFGIYWMHRKLHTNKWLYKHVHMMHHKYNKPETLTPWASIAFHPIDGILQACPYVLVLLVAPCHYLTHFGLLFFTAIWATYIHDAMDFNIFPIMGSKFHTVHHTHYIYNYGQVFQLMDWIFGTLRTPTSPTGAGSALDTATTTTTTAKSKVQ